jgi:hypothetical protein
MGPAFGSGGSFLGTAASTAAGVIGGGLLLNSIRSMFGEHAGLGGLERGGLGSSGARAADLAQQDRDQDQDQPPFPPRQCAENHRLPFALITLCYWPCPIQNATTQYSMCADDYNF